MGNLAKHSLQKYVIEKGKFNMKRIDGQHYHRESVEM